MGSSWNSIQWNQQPAGAQVTVISPPYDEIYLRNFITDLGQCDASSGQIYTINTFTVMQGQLVFNLSLTPNNQWPVIVFHNNVQCDPTEDYSYNWGVITFADSILSTGDSVIAIYWVSLP